MECRVLRIKADRLGEIGNRLVECTFDPVDHATTEVRRGAFRVESDGLSEVGDRLVLFARIPICLATAVVCPRRFRVEPDRLGIVGNGLVPEAEARISRAAVFVRWTVWIFKLRRRETGTSVDRGGA